MTIMKTALAYLLLLCAVQLTHAQPRAADLTFAAADPNYAEPLWRRPAFNNPPTPLPNTVKPVVQSDDVSEPVLRIDNDYPSRCAPLPSLKEGATRLENRIWTLTIIGLYGQCARKP